MKFHVTNTFRDPSSGELVQPRTGLVFEIDGPHAERLQQAQCLVPVPAPVEDLHDDDDDDVQPPTANGSQSSPAPAPVKGKRGR